jgi:hypothetical protein
MLTKESSPKARVIAKSLMHQMNHRQVDERFNAFRQNMIIFAQAIVMTQPGKCSFNQPSLRLYHESFLPFWSFDHSQDPVSQVPSQSNTG